MALQGQGGEGHDDGAQESTAKLGCSRCLVVAEVRGADGVAAVQSANGRAAGGSAVRTVAIHRLRRGRGGDAVRGAAHNGRCRAARVDAAVCVNAD